jgi:hypothetical protein
VYFILIFLGFAESAAEEVLSGGNSFSLNGEFLFVARVSPHQGRNVVKLHVSDGACGAGSGSGGVAVGSFERGGRGGSNGGG